MFGAQTRIVDGEGRPTRELIRTLQSVTGTSTTGLAGRVTALETSNSALLIRMSAAEGNITALQLTVSAQAVTIASHTAAIADLQADEVWVTPWP
jgi:hypothetical protein